MRVQTGLTICLVIFVIIFQTSFAGTERFDSRRAQDEIYLETLLDYAVQEAEAERNNQTMHHRNARDIPVYKHNYVKFTPKSEDIGRASQINIRAYEIMIGRLGVPKRTALNLLTKHLPDVCRRPTFVCERKSKYRNIDGTCNNLKRITWGASFTAFVRLVPASYSDGFNQPRGGREISNLPNARKVSTSIHPDLIKPDPILTNMVGQFGQFVDHDLTLTPEDDKRCCTGQTDTDCWPIQIYANDTFYSTRVRKQTCMDFTRSSAFCFPTNSGVREQMNILTAYADASNVYGSTSEREVQLRSFEGGRLRVHPNNSKLLPTVLQVKRETGLEFEFEGYFIAGDERVNEMPALTVLHNLFVREHNRIADQVFALKPKWDEEILFQETRRILIAEWQNILYGEYLPIILGSDTMRLYDLTLNDVAIHTDYNPELDATIFHSFATAAYRFGHTLINGIIKLMRGLEVKGSYRLRDNYFNEEPVVNNGGDGYNLILGGLVNQSAQTYDPFITEDLTNFLLRKRTEDFGGDLIARNLQRGRDHGLQGYNAYRDICRLPSLTTWANRPVESNPSSWKKLSELYNNPAEIDLFTGGLIEASVPGGLTGPTFNCLKAEQFHRLKYGDRHFFTHRGQAGSFHLQQLRHIRSRRFSDIICDNSNLEQIPRNVFHLSSATNPRINCSPNSSPARTVLNVALLINS